MRVFERMQPLHSILAQACARYATITPGGIVLPCSPTPYNPLQAAIIAYKPARTRYVNHHPICRSLNGINSINRRSRCIACEEKLSCTTQLALDIMYRSVPFRILLAYTSMRNFIAFCRTFRPPQQYVEGALVEISVLDRGRWGEACFAPVNANPAPNND